MSDDETNRIVETNAALAAEAFARALIAQGGPSFGVNAMETLRATMKVYLVAYLAELRDDAEQAGVH